MSKLLVVRDLTEQELSFINEKLEGSTRLVSAVVKDLLRGQMLIKEKDKQYIFVFSKYKFLGEGAEDPNGLVYYPMQEEYVYMRVGESLEGLL